MYEALLELDIKNLSRLLLHSRLFVLMVEICLLELLFGDLKCVCFEGLHVLSFPRSIHLRTSPISIMIGVYVGLSALQPVVHLIMSNNLEVCKILEFTSPDAGKIRIQTASSMSSFKDGRYPLVSFHKLVHPS